MKRERRRPGGWDGGVPPPTEQRRRDGAGPGEDAGGPNWGAVAVCLTAVFVIKLVVALQLGRQPLLQPDTGLDTTAYVNLAKSVLAGNVSLGPGLYYVSPLYIYFVALIYGVTKSFTAIRVVQALLGTVSVAMMFLTAREWFGPRAAWLTGMLAALTGIFAYYEGLILQASLDVVLTSVALWLLTLGLKRERARWYLLAGLAFGIASLNRPNMLLAGAAIALALLAVRQLRASLVLAAGLLAGLAPVTLRNVVVAHQWSLVTSHGGINFYIGNGEGATGYFHDVPGMRSTIEGLAVDARRVAEKKSGHPLTDGQVSAYYTSLTWDWIRRHPAPWMALLVRKAYGVFNAAHVSIPFSYTFYAYDAGTLLRFLFVGPWLLVPLGLLGLVGGMWRPDRRRYAVWLAFVPAYAVSVILFFITERYKLPLFVPLVIGSGAALDMIRRDLARPDKSVWATSLGSLALLAIIANWPLHLDDGRAEERMRMAELEAGRGNVTEAERWAAMSPESVHLRVAAQFLNSGQYEPAVAHLERAARTDPGDARTQYFLGRALLGDGKPGDALPHLERALAKNVDVPLAGYDLAIALQQTGDLPGAARALSRVNPPGDAGVEVWLQLGKRAGDIKDPRLAERFFRRAVLIAPKLSRAHYLLGLDLLVLSRFEEAERELVVATRLDPTNMDARDALAWLSVHTNLREPPLASEGRRK